MDPIIESEAISAEVQHYTAEIGLTGSQAEIKDRRQVHVYEDTRSFLDCLRVESGINTTVNGAPMQISPHRFVLRTIYLQRLI